MKRHFILLLAALANLAAALPSLAQAIDNEPAFHVGKLDNGLTYYLVHGDNPQGCADFYIVHNVGALQEEDNQNGLAHFLEHMAFNGTKHYPDKGILEFLAKEGVRFGYNVNAYTTRTETVYNLSSVPLVRESFVDSVLTVLHDWSCDISCEQKALDDERGVISEEWRRRDNAKNKITEMQTNLLYRGSKQTERNVIGKYDIINGFTRDEILEFYHKWYRPDLQAIVIAGDIDVDKMEAKIRSAFSDIVLVQNPAQKETYIAPDISGPRFDYLVDSSINYYAFKAFYRLRFPDREQRSTREFYAEQYCRAIITSILSDRMNEALKDPDCRVQRAVFVSNSQSTDFYVSQFTFTFKSIDDFPAAFRFYEQNLRRLREFGISQQEFDAAKLAVVKKYHLNSSIDPAEVKNADLVNTCVENFLRGYALVSPSDLREIQKEVMTSITKDEASSYIEKMFGTNEVIYTVSSNDKERDLLPDEEDLKAALAASAAEPLQPAFLTYKTLDINVSPAEGKVISSSAAKGRNGEDWILSNGAKVHWTPADALRGDVRLSMRICFNSGYRVFPQDKIGASRYAAAFLKRHAGFRGVDRTALSNYPELLGVTSSIDVGRRQMGLTLTSTKDKAENAFKLAHLQFTDPYLAGPDELAREKAASLKALDREKTDTELFNEKDEKIRYGSDPWRADFDSTAIEAVDFSLVEKLYSDMFSDPSAMTVYITSDLPRDTIEEYVSKYLASITGHGKPTLAAYHPAVPVYRGKNMLEETYTAKSEPKTTISYDWKVKSKQTPKNKVTYAILDYILSARYLALIREERGGTYTISFKSDNYSDDPELMESSVSFETRPEMLDVLKTDVVDVLGRMAKEGPTAAEMSDAVKYLVKHNNEVDERISHSATSINGRTYEICEYGTPYGFDYDAVAAKVKASDVKKIAAKIVSADLLANIYTEK